MRRKCYTLVEKLRIVEELTKKVFNILFNGQIKIFKH